jgi:hypothetical protein
LNSSEIEEESAVEREVNYGSSVEELANMWTRFVPFGCSHKSVVWNRAWKASEKKRVPLPRSRVVIL